MLYSFSFLFTKSWNARRKVTISYFILDSGISNADFHIYNEITFLFIECMRAHSKTQIEKNKPNFWNITQPTILYVNSNQAEKKIPTTFFNHFVSFRLIYVLWPFPFGSDINDCVVATSQPNNKWKIGSMKQTKMQLFKNKEPTTPNTT